TGQQSGGFTSATWVARRNPGGGAEQITTARRVGIRPDATDRSHARRSHRRLRRERTAHRQVRRREDRRLHALHAVRRDRDPGVGGARLGESQKRAARRTRFKNCVNDTGGLSRPQYAGTSEERSPPLAPQATWQTAFDRELIRLLRRGLSCKALRFRNRERL